MGPQTGWGRVSGNHHGGANTVSHVDGVSDTVPAHKLCETGLRKGRMASGGTSLWKIPASPVLVWMPDNSVPLYMSLMPFQLLPQLWSSEGVSLSKSLHKPFKRNFLGPRSPPSHLAITPAGFYSQKLWGLLFMALES